MTDDQRISELLERVMDGSDPEEACRDFPGLLPEVRQRWHHIRSVQSQLDGLFPSSHAGLDGHGSHGFGTPFARGELPHIPGYHVESLLGSGGIGAVYKAMHLKLKRSVAIKMLILGQYATERELTSLLKEAEAVAALRHPNIVQVHDVGDLDGQPFFTMEYVDGGSLAQKLGGRPLPAREAAKLIMALARAIEAAHSAGIVHRDLKPGNILLSIDGTPKVADFGLARRNEGDAALTLSSARMGTPSYMAPEQALGKPDAFAPAVDVYALGAILYELLTGRPPFSSELTAELLRQVVDEEPVSPLRLNPRLPRDLVTICLRCLQKSPSRRYANASALATDIEHFLNHEPILARPIGSIERGIRWARRKPAAAGLLITAVGLASLLIGVAAAEWNRQAALMAEKRRLTERLQSALQLEQQQQYSEARAILGRLGDAGFPDLRAQIDRALAEVDLVTTLDDLRMSRAMSGHLTFDRTAAQRAYERAFIVAGIGGPGEDPAIVAARISAMSVRSALVAAIDDWVFCTTEAEGRNWLLQVARLADPDPAWRDRVRDPSVWGDAATLSELAQNVNLGDQSVSLLLMFAGLLDRHDQDPVGFLYRVQAAHPGDFFASFVLAETLDGLDNADSIGYYRAAIAVRPRAVAAYVNLGNTLDRLGRADEALDSWERAVAVNPEALAAQYTLALGLLKRQRYEECINHCRKVTEMQSNNVMAHCMWADALIGLGRIAEAKAVLDRVDEHSITVPSERTMMTSKRRACEMMLDLESRLPEVLRGETLPVDADEAVHFADLCMNTQRFATAAQLYEKALEQFPQLFEQPGTALYNAACAAAQAGAGKGKDAGDLRPNDCEDLRSQSRRWLQADLERMRQQLAEAGDGDADETRGHLKHWLADPDLACIRDPAETQRWSEKEQAACRALWAEVENMLRRL